MCQVKAKAQPSAVPRTPDPDAERGQTVCQGTWRRHLKVTVKVQGKSFRCH